MNSNSKLVNLLAELSRTGISQKKAAAEVKMRAETFSKKVNGKTEFTIKQAIRIRNLIDPSGNMKVDYLFRPDGEL